MRIKEGMRSNDIGEWTKGEIDISADSDLLRSWAAAVFTKRENSLNAL